MKVKAVFASLLTAVALSGATAGEWCPPAKDVGKCPVDCCSDPLGFTLETGYDSAYYFRGLWFSNNNLWTSLAYTKAINDQLSYTLGAYYTSSQNTDIQSPLGDLEYSELDLFAALAYDAGFAKFGLQFTNYNFFDTFSGSLPGQINGNGFAASRDSQVRDARDLALTVSKSICGLNVYGLYAYDFRIEGHYAEVGADYPIAVSDCLSIIPSVQVGYNVDNYYTYAEVTGVEDGWNHIRPMITAPLKLTPCVTFVPYVGANFSLEAREPINNVVGGPGDHDVYGGAKLSVTF
jgi:hypothetical protein